MLKNKKKLIKKMVKVFVKINNIKEKIYLQLKKPLLQIIHKMITHIIIIITIKNKNNNNSNLKNKKSKKIVIVKNSKISP